MQGTAEPLWRIRAAEPQDCDTLAVLLGEAFRFYGVAAPFETDEAARALRRYLNHNAGFEALITEQPATPLPRPLGFAIFAPVFRTADCAPGLFLEELYLREEARGLGIGRAIMASLAKIASARGWSRINWVTDKSNEPALAFYDSLPGVERQDKQSYMISNGALRRFANL